MKRISCTLTPIPKDAGDLLPGRTPRQEGPGQEEPQPGAAAGRVGQPPRMEDGPEAHGPARAWSVRDPQLDWAESERLPDWSHETP